MDLITDSNCVPCSWPEQDAIDAWCNKHRIFIPHHQLIELKNAVTNYRIVVQGERDALWAKVIALKEALGNIADTADNLLHAAMLPVSNSIHVEGLRGGVEKIKKLAEPYVEPYSDDEEASHESDKGQ